MPLATLSPFCAERHIVTRAIQCPRCHARPGKPCIILVEGYVGDTISVHHYLRIATAHNLPIVELPELDAADMMPPVERERDREVLSAVRDILANVVIPADVPLLMPYVPPEFPPHWTEARVATSARIRSVYCPECEAAPGQPCMGRSAFHGKMRLHHGYRAAAAFPGRCPISDQDRLEEAV